MGGTSQKAQEQDRGDRDGSSRATYVDLTHSISPNMPVWTGFGTAEGTQTRRGRAPAEGDSPLDWESSRLGSADDI